MINRPKNWDNVQVFSERPKLPVGAYVCKIKKAVVQDNGYGKQLCLLFDIEDGEYAGFFTNDYKSNQREDKKWKGVLRQFLPKEDGSDKDEWTKSSLKTMLNAIEESNKGYRWNWDETTLSGKEIGIIFRNEEWEYNGKTGWTARPFKAISVNACQDCLYTLPDDKPLKNKPVASNSDFEEYPFTKVEDVDDGELPF